MGELKGGESQNIEGEMESCKCTCMYWHGLRGALKIF